MTVSKHRLLNAVYWHLPNNIDVGPESSVQWMSRMPHSSVIETANPKNKGKFIYFLTIYLLNEKFTIYSNQVGLKSVTSTPFAG